jgi:hypothetical protein
MELVKCLSKKNGHVFFSFSFVYFCWQPWKSHLGRSGHCFQKNEKAAWAAKGRRPIVTRIWWDKSIELCVVQLLYDVHGLMRKRPLPNQASFPPDMDEQGTANGLPEE